MLTILIPNYYSYADLNNIVLEFVKVKSTSVHMIIIDADDELIARNKINTHDCENIKVYYGLRSGVYAAFNFGIKQVKTKYYMVLGVDDIFNFNKLDLITNVLKSTNYDLLFLGIEKSGIVSNSLKNDSFLSIFPSHTGGTIINKYLHDRYGLYSNNYKVLSDGFFISQCLLDKNIKFGLLSEIFCLVGDQGFSKKNEYLAEFEAFSIRNKLGQAPLTSFYIFLTRLSKRVIKNSFKFFILK